MSWYGIHATKESKKYCDGERYLPYGACRKCKYKLQIALSGLDIFKEEKCTRCGLVFPATKVASDYTIMHMGGWL
jgi:hypothetical protein